MRSLRRNDKAKRVVGSVLAAACPAGIEAPTLVRSARPKGEGRACAGSAKPRQRVSRGWEREGKPDRVSLAIGTKYRETGRETPVLACIQAGCSSPSRQGGRGRVRVDSTPLLDIIVLSDTVLCINHLGVYLT